MIWKRKISLSRELGDRGRSARDCTGQRLALDYDRMTGSVLLLHYLQCWKQRIRERTSCCILVDKEETGSVKQVCIPDSLKIMWQKLMALTEDGNPLRQKSSEALYAFF